MPVCPSWQTWRLALLPVAESFLWRQPAAALPKIRPYLLAAQCTPRRSAHSIASVGKSSTPLVKLEKPGELDREHGTPSYVSSEIKERYREIEQYVAAPYPRYVKNESLHKTLIAYHRTFGHLSAGEVTSDGQTVQVEGRIKSIRKAGKKLAFIDIAEGHGDKLQVLLKFGSLEKNGLKHAEFFDWLRLLRRGDVISIRGHPHRTDAGELSISATQLPKILSPCLHPLSVKEIPDDAAQEIAQHIVMLASPDPIQVLIRRAKIIQIIRDFFNARDFVEVQTPILAGAAGGATARPFETAATEFSNRKLSLRIAPELWLKRLIIGGMSKIFEIGPSFRNEGLDRTHNPEFTTCEFYQAYTALPELLSTTESLLSTIAPGLEASESTLPSTSPSLFKGPYPQIDFIPALNTHLGLSLPNLSSPTAHSTLLAIFNSKDLPIPPNPTLPRLLDSLASSYLEPLCQDPTWIIHTPECLSPLAKSSIHPTAPHNQPVAARAELFVRGRELVNCYEEENSPWEQRRKFAMQAEDGEGTRAVMDEDYLRALEWGLPPTGGWGCGIDRLAMLFTGKERIGDVLSFGNLRRVTRGARKWEENVSNPKPSDGEGSRA